jgi:nucleotide-binding universal stress UspA family protein
MVAPYHHIACCVDDSEAAARALAQAVALRDLCEARLSVVHVLPQPNVFVSVGAALGGAPVHDVATEREAAGMWLDELALESSGEAVLLEGDPPHEACAWAKEAGCDLMVVASHRGTVERTLLGSFAGHLAHHAPSAVLLVPPDVSPAT